MTRAVGMAAVGMAAATLLATPLWARPPGGPDDSPRRGMGRMRGLRRDNSKARLEGVLMGVGSLERGGKTPLSKDQARKMVALISGWKKKSHMSDAEAQSLSGKLSAVLTSAQKNAIQQARPQNRRGDRRGPDGRGDGGRPNGGRRGGFGGGMGRMGGGFGGDGPTPEQRQQMQKRMQALQNFMKTYNPFYPPTKYKEVNSAPERMRQGMTRRYEMTMALLSQLSKKAGR